MALIVGMVEDCDLTGADDSFLGGGGAEDEE